MKRTIFLNIFFLVCFYSVFSQDRSKIDSLFLEFKRVKSDTNGVNLIISLSENFQRIDLDSSMIFAEQALKFSKQLNYTKGLANSNHCIGMVYVYKGEYDSCLKYWNKCLDLRLKLKDSKGISSSYNNIGIVYKNIGKYEKSVEYFQKALKIFEQRNDKLNISNCLSNMGNIQSDLKNYDKAIEYYLNSLKIKKEIGDDKDIASCYLNIGSGFKDKGDPEKAFKYYKYSLGIFEKIGDKRGASSCYATIGAYYETNNDFILATKYYQKSLHIKESLGDKFGVSLLNANLASLYINMANTQNLYPEHRDLYYKKSVEYSEKALAFAQETGSLPRIHSAYQVLYSGWGKLNNFKKAFEYAEIFIKLNDSLLNADKTKVLEEMEAKYQSEKKQLNIEKLENETKLQNEVIAHKEAENKQQRILIFSFIVGFLTILVFSILLFRLFVQKKKANKQLALQNEEILQKNEEINTQKEEIESQRDFVIMQKEENEIIHKELTDSINYAQYIQQAVLHSHLNLENIVTDSFILFKPKDIVSGDFYWINKINNWLIIAVVDCTGHGVPGAFMSMLGISFLNEIVRNNDVMQTNHILNRLRTSIIDALNQTGNSDEQKDGMDMSLLAIKIEENTTIFDAQWSGANNPLYIIKNEKLQLKNLDISDSIPDFLVSEYEEEKTLKFYELKGDKMPIAIYGRMDNFTMHEFQLQKGDLVYLKTDGYEDSIGGPKERKYLSKNLKHLLFDNSNFPMVQQKQILENTLKDWVGNNEQIDDITILGLKI